MARFHYKSAMHSRKKRPGVLARRDIITLLGHGQFTWLPYEVLRDCLDIFFDEIICALERGEKVDIEGLGTFERRVWPGGPPPPCVSTGLPRPPMPPKPFVYFVPDRALDRKAYAAQAARDMEDVKKGRL